MRLRLSSLCQTEPFPNRKFVTVTGTHPQSLITWPYSCWSFLWSCIVDFFVLHQWRRDSFHHTDAQGFLKTKPLQRAMPSDHRPQIVCLIPSPQAHTHTHVCVCIMLAGVDITDAHYVLCMRPTFYMSLVIVIDIMSEPCCMWHMSAVSQRMTELATKNKWGQKQTNKNLCFATIYSLNDEMIMFLLQEPVFVLNIPLHQLVIIPIT